MKSNNRPSCPKKHEKHLVMVVDDDYAARLQIRLTLENAGLEVVEAVSGQDALNLFRNVHPDLVLLDIVMPGMDGFDTCRSLRDLPGGTHTPIVIVTGEDDPQTITRAFEVGATDFISKPIKVHILGYRARYWLRSGAILNELKISEDRLLKAQDIARLCHWERDLETGDFQLTCHHPEIFGLSFPCTYDELFAKIVSKDKESVKSLIDTACLNQCPFSVRYHITLGDGSESTLLNRGEVIRDGPLQRRLVVATIHDVTDFEKMEEERDKLQLQMNQIRKMESIGRLAGGVAHDFNNMLNVILGYTEIALEETDPGSSLHNSLLRVLEAGQRSANITRQLLAFARKQPITPTNLNLNEAIEQGVLQMLRRLIGENILLAWKPKSLQWKVRIDASQIDQVLVNLCLNARDAITGTGRITIETGEILLDEFYCKGHTGAIPGEYVLLMVSDDGCGIKKEILDNIFEPFFTTKEVGQGTGLGLATVYGIVKQNNGYINAYSEQGKGATFSIYLPRQKDPADQLQMAAIPTAPCVDRSHETILLVEDEPMILEMITIFLQLQGYTVLATAVPGEVMAMAEKHSGMIHLLITDVIMPEINGAELAGLLVSRYSDIRVLYMSGYTAEIIAQQGIIDVGVNFIQKPFSMEAFTLKVREVLEKPQTR